MYNKIVERSEVRNAYEDEDTKLNSDFENELSVWVQIKEVLDYHGYDLTADLVNGLPEITLVKRT